MAKPTWACRPIHINTVLGGQQSTTLLAVRRQCGRGRGAAVVRWWCYGSAVAGYVHASKLSGGRVRHASKLSEEVSECVAKPTWACMPLHVQRVCDGQRFTTLLAAQLPCGSGAAAVRRRCTYTHQDFPRYKESDWSNLPGHVGHYMYMHCLMANILQHY